MDDRDGHRCYRAWFCVAVCHLSVVQSVTFEDGGSGQGHEWVEEGQDVEAVEAEEDVSGPHMELAR